MVIQGYWRRKNTLIFTLFAKRVNCKINVNFHPDCHSIQLDRLGDHLGQVDPVVFQFFDRICFLRSRDPKIIDIEHQGY